MIWTDRHVTTKELGKAWCMFVRLDTVQTLSVLICNNADWFVKYFIKDEMQKSGKINDILGFKYIY